jgi:hypothetical protein
MAFRRRWHASAAIGPALRLNPARFTSTSDSVTSGFPFGGCKRNSGWSARRFKAVFIGLIMPRSGANTLIFWVFEADCGRFLLTLLVVDFR